MASLRRGEAHLEALVHSGDSVVCEPHEPKPHAPVLAALDLLGGVAFPFDRSARILVLGMVGLVAMLTVDVVVGTLALHESLVSALFLAVRTLVTVGPNVELAQAAAGVRLVSVATMLGALASAAVFTAGLVNRLLDERSVGIVGRRAMPRRDHVVIVGMGQVGLRLALLLRDAGVPVVGVERKADASLLRLARRYGLPVVVADGGDRELLARLSLGRARALAAVTSDDLGNVAIALAARAAQEDLRVVLRAGDGEVAAETRSLLHLGDVCDAHRLAGVGLAAAALGWQPGDVIMDQHGLPVLIDRSGGERRLPLAVPVRAAPADRRTGGPTDESSLPALEDR